MSSCPPRLDFQSFVTRLVLEWWNTRLQKERFCQLFTQEESWKMEGWPDSGLHRRIVSWIHRSVDRYQLSEDKPRARNFVFVPERLSQNRWRLVNIRRGKRVASVYYERLDWGFTVNCIIWGCSWTAWDSKSCERTKFAVFPSRYCFILSCALPKSDIAQQVAWEEKGALDESSFCRSVLSTFAVCQQWIWCGCFC